MTNINKSITATIKSISEKKNLIFSFNNKITKIEGNKVFLPDSNLLKKKIDVKNYRGVADFLALKITAKVEAAISIAGIIDHVGKDALSYNAILSKSIRFA